MLKRTYKTRKLSFHAMHSLWLVLKDLPGANELELSRVIVEMPSKLRVASGILYGRPIQGLDKVITTLGLSGSLSSVGYFKFKEVMNGQTN